MLLVMCRAGPNRYALDSRHTCEVLPRVNLHRLSGSPAWFAGLLIYRGRAIPVIDLSELTQGVPCPSRLSSRIVLLQTELDGIDRSFGILVERVGLREMPTEPREQGGGTAGPATLGTMCLDEEGVYQLVDVSRLVSRDRQAVLFPAVERAV